MLLEKFKPYCVFNPIGNWKRGEFRKNSHPISCLPSSMASQFTKFGRKTFNPIIKCVNIEEKKIPNKNQKISYVYND